jgi:hypothetical protein
MLFESMIPTMQIDMEKVINEARARRGVEYNGDIDTPSGENAMDSPSIPAKGSADVSVAPDTVNLLNPPSTDMKPMLKPTLHHCCQKA